MLPGVYQAKKKDNTIYFRSSITYSGKHISLGSFDTEKKGARGLPLRRQTSRQQRNNAYFVQKRESGTLLFQMG